MARTKSSKSSSQKSTSARSSKAAPKSSNTDGARASQKASSHSTLSTSANSRLKQARGFVESNASVQAAGIALAGAGLLALVSTPAGRNLIRVAADAVVSLVSHNAESIVDAAKKSTKSARDQARL